MINEFFSQIRNKKIRRTDWSDDEYFIPYRLILHKEPYANDDSYFMLGQYYLNDVEFIICEQEVASGFEPDKYGTKWELYTGEKHYDHSQTH